jgi:Phage regulatory protein CII (CP76)
LPPFYNRFRLAKRLRLFHFAAMQSHELLHEVFKAKPTKQVSDEIGISASVLYKWAELPEHAGGSGVSNPLDRVEALLRSTGDPRIAQWICERANGFFIRNPKNIPQPHYLIPATNQIVQEFADLLNVVAQAAHDNEVTQAEAKQIRSRWEALKSVTEGFVACCENGNFEHIHKQAARRVSDMGQPRPGA